MIFAHEKYEVTDAGCNEDAMRCKMLKEYAKMQQELSRRKLRRVSRAYSASVTKYDAILSLLASVRP